MKMVSLLSGDNVNIISIKTDDFTLNFMGSISNKKAEAIKANLNTPAFIKVISDEYLDVETKTLCTNGELEVNDGYNMFPCFFEDGIYQIWLEKNTESNIEIYHISSDIRKKITPIGNNLIGAFSFSGEIGYSTFKIKKQGRIVLELTIEVFPTKMDYRKDYFEIMNDVNEEIASLAFEFLGKTYHSSGLSDVKHQTAAEFVNILKIIFKNLEKALIRIERNPKHIMLNSDVVNKFEKAKKPSRNSLNYLRKHPHVLAKISRGFININEDKYIPTKLLENKKITTIDIFENRYVKYILKSIIKRLSIIRNTVQVSYGVDNEYYILICDLKKKLEFHLNSFFRNIGELTGRKSMSLVFQMAPGYKQVYYNYTLLKKGLTLSEDIYNITPKKLWKLYEIWCYMKLHNILKNIGYGVENYGIIRVTDNGLSLSLIQDKEAGMTYSNNEGKKIELWYNKSYSKLPTASQRPDTVLCLKSSDNDERIYIFDAKYRLCVESNGDIGPMEDDINVMHRYRDAIVEELGETMQFKYKTFGAYVMFPYSDESKFSHHKYYESIESVNIGAFPMLPGSTNLIRKHLEKILCLSTIEAKQERVAVDEFDDYAKFKLENVMVVNVKDEEHLKAYVENKFYHIPAIRLSNVRLGVAYLAFYESKKSFSESSGINFYGKIKEVKRYKRAMCTEIPVKRGNEEEDYLRFELEELIEIKNIKPVEYGTQLITYTTLYLLKNAGNIHELKLKNRDEIELYKLLKKISKEKGLKLLRKTDCYVLDGRVIEMLLHGEVRVDGRIVEAGEIERECL
ncbi:MAG: DUF2357 domain-containing protein [Clostridium sp.]|uniref:DUF2357 domain-containing protein n=1 Tax=Clostridium sp. TaxID=1506 RepID=UPI003D6D08DB